MSEAQTRKELIDQQLKLAGWNVQDQSQVATEYNIGVAPDAGVQEPAAAYYKYQYSDYVLLGKNGKPLAVIEAKKTGLNAQLGQEQARQYCYNIQKSQGGELPFCLYTNGLETYFWDLGNYPPKKVMGFPSRDDLERYAYLRRNRKPLAAELINTNIAGRDYQIRAIRSVMEGLEQKKSQFLLVMATGTGKTRTCVALVDALMRAGWIERTLFLVDRIALRDQGLDAFKEHLPNEPRWPKLGEKLIASDRRIYVATYPTMLNIIRDEANSLSPHFFDLVVVDESHRSIYNTYQEVLNYFNTTTLGLTATPTDVIDHNTFKLFACNDGLPTFAYSYEEAVQHKPPYLSSFQVMKIQTKFQKEGINKRSISLEDQKQLILEGKEVVEINFEGSDLEKTVTNKGTNVAIVKAFMDECIKDSNGVLPGKTIFFCTGKPHARRMEEVFNALYPEYNGELARVLVSDDSRVYGKGGLLHQFKHNNMPRVAISVDMLDTGIDVRELVNLVFAKPVYSYTKFWQMIGRGTRLLEPQKMKPWCLKKEAFLIMDCWDNFEYFKLQPKGKALKTQVPLPLRFARLRLDKIEKALERGREAIANKETLLFRQQIALLPRQSVALKEARTHLARLEEETFWQPLTSEKLDFLRQHILPLFKTQSQIDFKAMRFQKEVLETSLAHLMQESEQLEALKEHLKEQVADLSLGVNLVAKERTYINQVLSNRFWARITDAQFDEMAERLSPLLKFTEQNKVSKVTTQLNLRDLVQTREMVEFGPEKEAVSISQYRDMVERKIAEMSERHPVLQKLKAGHSINEAERQDLATALFEENPHITEELLRKAYKQQKASFMQFIKHILGLEALQSFDEQVSTAVQNFIKAHSQLSSAQIDFLHLLRDYMIERGSIEKRNLIEAPFTVIDPKGIRGLFSPHEINQVVKLVEQLAA